MAMCDLALNRKPYHTGRGLMDLNTTQNSDLRLVERPRDELLRLVPLGPHRLRFRMRVYPNISELAVLELFRRGILLGSEIDTGGGRWIQVVEHPAFEGLIEALSQELSDVVSNERGPLSDHEVTRPGEPLPSPVGLEEESSDMINDIGTLDEVAPLSRRSLHAASPDPQREPETEVIAPRELSLKDLLFDELKTDETPDSLDYSDEEQTTVLPSDDPTKSLRPSSGSFNQPPEVSKSKEPALRFPIGQTPPRGSERARPESRREPVERVRTDRVPEAPQTPQIDRRRQGEPARVGFQTRPPRSASLPSPPPLAVDEDTGQTLIEGNDSTLSGWLVALLLVILSGMALLVGALIYVRL